MGGLGEWFCNTLSGYCKTSRKSFVQVTALCDQHCRAYTLGFCSAAESSVPYRFG